MAAFLLLQALAQRLHQLLPAAQRLDLFLLLLGQGEFDLLQQPFKGNLRLDAGNGFHALPEFGESAVELVEIGFVLHQRDAGEVVELVDRGFDDLFLHGLEQRQVLLDGDRQLVAFQLEEEIDQHGGRRDRHIVVAFRGFPHRRRDLTPCAR